MSVVKTLKWAAAVSVVGVLVVGVTLYMYASRIPENYLPAQLRQDEKKQVAHDFVNHLLAFGNDAQHNRPYTWSVTAEQLNAYLASMDEIATNLPGGEPGKVYEMMDSIGLAEPAVAMNDGVLIIMARLREYNKVLSADVSLTVTSKEKLRIRLEALRVGRLIIPDSYVGRWMEELKRTLSAGWSKSSNAGAKRPKAATFTGLSSDDIASVLGVAVSAINEEPISPELTWPVNKKRVRIEAIDIDDGRATLHVVPVRRKGGED